MIRTQRPLEDLDHAGCYALGYQDAMDSLELGADSQAMLQTSRASKRLSEILDAIWNIAPYPALHPATPVWETEVATGSPVVEQVPFDGEAEA